MTFNSRRFTRRPSRGLTAPAEALREGGLPLVCGISTYISKYNFYVKRLQF